ncbi:MAG: hypothetical protein LCH73_03430 [Proteobacteria bacterium]|nr:hypothetical protein [Pseudomonadota bacterium]
MTSRIVPWLLALLATTSLAAPPTAIPQGPAPQLDGVLAPGEWEGGATWTTWLPTRTHAPETAEAATRLAARHDGQWLYIAFDARQPAGAPVQAHSLRRDAESIAGDDHLALVLDPQGTGRNGFMLMVNALGARRDGIVFDGNQLHPEWDANWVAKTQVRADGWSAELAIPLAALGAPAGTPTWGLNAERRIGAMGLWLRLAAADSGRTVLTLADALPVQGPAPSHAGWGLRLEPALRGSIERGQGTQRELAPALDAFWRATPGVTVSATFNTNFAYAPLDDRVISLSRFEIFRPDRRPFFTQDAGRFAFGGLADGGDPNLLPFFSRRVGLGRTLDAGLKVSGTAGPVDFGVLAVQTERTGDDVATPRALVLRATTPLGATQHAGLIATRGSPDGAPGSALVGVDHRWRDDVWFGGEPVQTDLWWLQSTHAVLGQGQAWGGRLRADGLGPVATLGWQHIDDAFEPALGYVMQAGITRGNALAGWRERTAAGSTWQAALSGEATRRLDGREHDVMAGPQVEWENTHGDGVFAQVFHEDARFDEGYAPLPGLWVAPGRYDWTAFMLEAWSSTARPLYGHAFMRHGTWQGGHLTVLEAGLTWQPNAHWSAGLTLTQQAISLPGGSGRGRTASATVSHTPSTDAELGLVMQYDNISGQWLAGWRTRWAMTERLEWRLAIDHARASQVAQWAPGFTRASLALVGTWSL